MAESPQSDPGTFTNILVLLSGIALGVIVGRMIVSFVGLGGIFITIGPAVGAVISTVLVLLLYNRVFLS